jgi:hypothetical protein
MPEELPPKTESYLGDGLYASFDGSQIILRAPRMEGDHYVGLEPAVMRELLKFAKELGMVE